MPVGITICVCVYTLFFYLFWEGGGAEAQGEREFLSSRLDSTLSVEPDLITLR